MFKPPSEIINEERIFRILSNIKSPSRKIISDILDKAKQKKGLEVEEIGILINVKDHEIEQQILETAHLIKKQIYGECLVFFAPLYISDFCVNDCKYCNFQTRNKNLKRKKLTLAEIEQQSNT